MIKLTDLEICKRIAEIDCAYSEIKRDRNGAYVLTSESRDYNPLTDDALCFQLMIKYGVEIIPAWDRVGINNGTITIANYNDSPSRAICLAIIEARKND